MPRLPMAVVLANRLRRRSPVTQNAAQRFDHSSAFYKGYNGYNGYNGYKGDKGYKGYRGSKFLLFQP